MTDRSFRQRDPQKWNPVDPDYDELDFSHAKELVDQRQRFRRRPKTAANVISRMMARQGYGQTQSNDELNEAWEIAAGPTFTKNTKVGRINRGVLEVHVASSAAMNQLSFTKQQLLAAMQKQLPQNNIKDLRFKLGNMAR